MWNFKKMSVNILWTNSLSCLYHVEQRRIKKTVTLMMWYCYSSFSSFMGLQYYDYVENYWIKCLFCVAPSFQNEF